MQIHFKGTNYELTSEVSAHATKKLRALRKHLGGRKETAFVYVDLGKESGAHINGRIWYAEVNLECDGSRFYAKATEETLENAVDRAVEELGNELRRANEKQNSLLKRGGLRFKNLFRFGTP